MPIETCQAMQYYLKFQHDVIDTPQTVNIQFNDIEVFTNNRGVDSIEGGAYPINALASYDTQSNILTSFFLLMPQNMETYGISQDPNFDYDGFIQNRNQWMSDELIKHGYVKNQYIPNPVTIDIQLFNDEKELLKTFWTHTHKIDPDVLTSWNGDHFDYPYIWHRLVKLFGSNTAQWLMSKLGHVEYYNEMLTITDYAIADLLYLYKPRDDSSGGGLNYGDKQPQYTLDWIAEAEVNLKKVEYKSKNITLDNMYLNDPIMFQFYNIVDTILILAINNKCKHIELHNDIRRLMKTSFSLSMRGSSQLFDHFTYAEQSKIGKYIRYGISTETSKEIPLEVTKKYVPMRDKKGVIQKPIKVPAKSKVGFVPLTSRFPGAYVKEPIPRIIKDGSLTIDLDASRLYPSMILQYNISFDSYIGRIIPPTCNIPLQMMEQIVGKTTYPDQLAKQLNERSLQYVDSGKITKKKETSQSLYYIMMHLFDTIANSGTDMYRIYNPTNNQEAITLKTCLIPLLDVLNLTHPDNPGYNQLGFDYVMMEEEAFANKYPYMYIIHNPNESNMYIKKYSAQEAIQLIKQNIITIAGTLFTKHATHIGLFGGFLQQMYNMRKQYKRARVSAENEFGRSSSQWSLAENRQKSIKVVMNTTYGLYGQSGFRYSNHWLAQSITNMGMFTVKQAQYQAETYLEYKYGQGVING